MIIQINHRLTGKLLFEAQDSTLAQAITAANEKLIKARHYSSDGHFLGQSYQTLDLQGANLAGADLRGAELSSINLTEADLQGADLRQTRLWLTDLYGADLRGADLREARLEGAGWDLSERLNSKALLIGANFTGCYLGMSWSSHLLLTELLRQAAGPDQQKQRAGEFIPRWDSPQNRNRINWRAWEASDYPLKAWSLDVLSTYVHKEDDTLSRMLRNHANRT